MPEDRSRHWSIGVEPVENWRELEVYAADLRPGDLWLDPHGDNLRGCVATVERSDHEMVDLVTFLGLDPPWKFSPRRPLRIVRPTPEPTHG